MNNADTNTVNKTFNDEKHTPYCSRIILNNIC